MNFISKLFWPITAPIKFIQENFKTVFFLTIVYFLVVNTQNTDIKPANLQKIDLKGPIMSASDVLEKIEQAKNNPNIKGVLLDVNSPGGAVAPSIEIAYAIKELKKRKPVIAYASGVMASGSYYASIWAQKIIANPGSMVGSIGVIMQSVDASELMAKIGVKTQTVKMGAFKEAGTPTRQWTEKERKELEKITKSTYDMFVTDVANARKLKIEEHKLYADAHIFTSVQAKNVGLIDEVATLSKARSDLIALSGVKDPVWVKEDKMEKFIDRLANETILKITNNLNGLMAY
eukprot:Anaeramoba_ignava/a487665_25.p1 GENE.a487665_25~~a487665_25.p1  ORF type:complete len:290 (-),score=-14.33 a487665_25:963-1832(-)